MNTDKSKTRTELLNELKESRQRLVQAEAVEKGLKREVEKYAHLASFSEANPSPVLELDPKGTIKYMNPATIHLFPNLATLGTKHPFLADWAQVVKELQSSNWGKSIVRGVVVEGLVYEQLVSVVTENQIRMYGRNVTELKDAEKASKESEERFRLASQIASDVVYERDLQIGIATFYGDIDCHLGYEPGEFPRTMEGWREHVHPEDLARIDRQGLDQLESGVPYGIEYRMRKKDGTYMTWSDRIMLIRDKETDEPIKFIGAATDITERKKADDALRESEERYRSLVNNVKLGVLRSTPGPPGKILEVNPALEALTGYSRDELLAMEMEELYVDCEERQALMEEFSAKRMVTRELHWRKKDGTEIIVLDTLTSLRDDAGKVLYVDAIIEDITERKQAEEALSQSEERFRLIAQSSPDCIVQTDKQGTVIYASPSVKRILGYDPEEIEGGGYVDILPASTLSKTEHILRQVFKGEVLHNVELYLLHKNGNLVPCEVSAAPIAVKNEVTAFLAIVRDITERKRAEKELEKIDRLESLGILAGGIAHDFNNLLTGILGNVQLAKLDTEAGKTSRVADELLEAEKTCLRATDLTRQLLTFSRGGAPIRKSLSIKRLVEDSTTFALRGSNVKCQCSMPDDLWAVEADEGQIRQVINNLVINADQAMPKGGIIEITATNRIIGKENALLLPGGNYIELMVKDHGIGIAKEHMDRIFDPYFTTKHKGSGLGLTTAYSIIKAHAGHITVESELGVGATFHVYLPATKRKPRKERKIVEESQSQGKGRILVMDDEETIRRLLDDVLTRAGYEVVLTKDGVEAIERYTEAKESGQPIDAVILDLTIPGSMGGEEAMKKLLQIDPEVKGIVSSGYANDRVMAEYEKHGFSAVVAKPYKISELRKTLHSVLKS